jgi:hypothetical protein
VPGKANYYCVRAPCPSIPAQQLYPYISIMAAAKEHNCPVDDIRMKMEYLDDIEW